MNKTNKPRIDVDELKHLASGRWPEILARTCGIAIEILDGRHHPCPHPHCGGTDRFRFIDPTAGACYCNRCFSKENGDGFAAIMWLTGCTFPEAVTKVADYLGTSPNGNGRASQKPKRKRSKTSKPNKPSASPELLHRAYSIILGELSLSDSHEKQLTARGLNERYQGYFGYKTYPPPNKRKAIARKLLMELGADAYLIPGFAKTTHGISLVGPPGLLIPVRDVQRRIVALKVRMDEPREGEDRYLYVSSKRYGGGPSPGAPVHVPLGTADKDTSTVRITEGELKADVTSALSGESTISVPGVGNWKPAIPVLKELGAKTVCLAYDADAQTKAGVAGPLKDLADRLPTDGYQVELETWNISDGKGIDDLLASGKKPSVLSGDDATALIDEWVSQTGADKSPAPKGRKKKQKEITAAIANVEIVEGDKPGEYKTVALPMQNVRARIEEKTGGELRRVENTLFVNEGGICWFLKTSQLFGWLQSKTGTIDWRQIDGCCSKAETFEELARTVQQYAAIEHIPHHPPIENHYYTSPPPAVGDLKTVDRLLEFFTPETPVDAWLLLSCWATLFWGGPPGARPAFLFTATGGRGKGKSKAAQFAASLVGGYVDVSPSEDIVIVKQRLLSPEATEKRVALLDNVKTTRFSWGALESLITADQISGKRLYVGEARRPNYLTWCITLNGAALSTDLAQRVVEIRLGEPDYRGAWESDVRDYITTNHQAIVGDLLAYLQRSQQPLSRQTRWATWDSEVLARADNPDECMKVILDRRGQVDVEVEEGEILEDFFAAKLTSLDYDLDTADVFIPNTITTLWFNQAMGEKRKTSAVSRAIKQMYNEGRLSKIEPTRHGESGARGVRWAGEHCDASAPTENDLAYRIAKNLENR